MSFFHFRDRCVVPALLIAVSCAACSQLFGGGAQAQRCAAGWQARLDALAAASERVDEAARTREAREAELSSGEKAVAREIAAVTLPFGDRESYADRVKGLVARKKMRLGSMTPFKREQAPGDPAVAIWYDLELQGDYRKVANAVAGLYEQPKYFQLSRVEVNISEPNRRGWTVVRAQGWVYETPAVEAAVGGMAATSSGTLAAAILAAEADDPPSGCGEPSPAPASIATALAAARARLDGRAADVEAIDALDARERRLAARRALLAELLRRRDDNKAQFATHVDELVRRALESVTLLAELRFDPNGDPEWK